MKYFQHQFDDVMFWIDRAHFDAEHGRAKLALDRLEELEREFPDNPHIFYDQALIRYVHIGQGLKARVLFRKAYDLARNQEVKGTQWYAARYAAIVALTAEEFTEWADVIFSLAPRGHNDQIEFRETLSKLKTGVPYFELLLTHGQQAEKAKFNGSSAALMEIALQVHDLPLPKEVHIRRVRAERLRMLDRTDHNLRETMAETFPLDERLSLHEAVIEIEHALELDSYDAVLWNLKAAWCNLLGRHSEALASANRAIDLRQPYSRPWINKAAALWELHCDTDAMACARKALEQAEASDSEFQDDIAEAQRIIKEYSLGRVAPSLQNLLPMINQIVAVAMKRCKQELHGTEPGYMARGLLSRVRLTESNRSISFVPMMAQLLSDFSPEIAFAILIEVSSRNLSVYKMCLNAAMYLAADSEGVQQRDAARFIILNLFFRALLGADFIQQTYREAILEISHVASAPLSEIDNALRRELGRIHADLPALITNQEPLTKSEIVRGRQAILEHFTGDPHEFETPAPALGLGYEYEFDSFSTRWRKRLFSIFQRTWLEIRGQTRPRKNKKK